MLMILVGSYFVLYDHVKRALVAKEYQNLNEIICHLEAQTL